LRLLITPAARWQIGSFPSPSFSGVRIDSFGNFQEYRYNGHKALPGEKPLVEGKIKDATKILNLLRSMADYKAHFEIIGNYRLIDDGIRPEATIMLRADDKEMHEADTGVGPVDALAKVLKKSLKSLFPEVDQIKLIDFSSRIFDPGAGTAAKVEVEILFSNGKDAWRVQAFSENICQASFLALVDGFEYGIYIFREKKD
jgi:hypothetical protein